MIHRRSLFVLLSLVFTACATGSAGPGADPEPHHVDPAGTYDLVFEMRGMQIAAVMVIEGDVRSGWTGAIDSDAGPATITEIRIDGHDLTFTIPEAQGRVELHLDDGVVHGEMTGGMGGAKIRGEKR